MILKFAHYLSSVRDRIPLRHCLGYHYYLDICQLVVLVSDVCRFFVRTQPWAELIVNAIMCLFVSAFAVIGICSKKQSILNLLPDCPKTKGYPCPANYIMFLHEWLMPYLSCLFFAGGDSLTISIIHTSIINFYIFVYFGCQFYILKCGDELLEMAAEGMNIKRQL